MKEVKKRTSEKMESMKHSSKARLTVFLCMLMIIAQHHQKANSQEALSGQQQAQKLGLAPHDRPSCQLAPITNHRRHLQESNLFDQAANHQAATAQNLTELGEDNLRLNRLQQSNINNNNVKIDTSERLRQLRQLLNSNNYDGYLVTPNDEHGSEYVAEFDRRIKFISGFSGSMGYALILLDRAVLFTDGRYAIQADKELDCNWWLVVGDSPLADIPVWLKLNAAKGIKIASDARLLSLQTFDYLEEQIRKLDSELSLVSQDFVDVLYHPVDVKPNTEALFVHAQQFTGDVSWLEKVTKLASLMSKYQARHYIVSQLDDIAWLLNLRGNDIPNAPLFKAYLFISKSEQPAGIGNVVTDQQAKDQQQLLAVVDQPTQVLSVQPNQLIKLTLYVDLKKITQQVRDHLQLDNGTNTFFRRIQQDGTASRTKIQVELKDYEVFIVDLRDRLSRQQLQGKLLLNSAANVAIHVLAKNHDDRIILAESLVQKMKAVKSDSEVQGMRLAHYRDSLAISMLLAELELDIEKRHLVDKWSEISAAKELEFYRTLMDYNKGLSFPTISAYASNAAIVHYSPGDDESSSERVLIGNQSTYLLDSGGQYLDGTTDITRTMHYGEPSDFQRETYTRVLMGAIDVMSLIIEQSNRVPYRVNDMIARRHLFEIGLDYAHGTGHGIGMYSLVHEAPHMIESYLSVSQQRQAQANKQPNSSSQQQPLMLSEPTPVQANMFTSVEPGYYKANDFGIRLENIVVTQKVDLPYSLMRQNDRQQVKSTSLTNDILGLKTIAANKSTAASGAPKIFLRFEPISLVPFEPKLIKFELLSNKQKAWLNSYNMMVRLKMTQQINHYLNKIREQISLKPTLSGSRIYQMLQSVSNNSTSSGGTERISPSEFQEKLELTHKWIMSKTELIPLDLPQSFLKTNNCTSDSMASNNNNNSKHPQAAGQTNKQPITREGGSSTGGATLDGQRLMLAYMSSLPMNDLEAGEAVAASFQQQQTTTTGNDVNSPLLGRAESNATQKVPALTTTKATTPTINKCHGLECDLLLVSALNPQQQQQQQQQQQHLQRITNPDPVIAASAAAEQTVSAQRHQRQRGQSLQHTWLDQTPDESLNGNNYNMESGGNSAGGSLFELFQLDGPASASNRQFGAGMSMINMWALGVLLAIALIQLVAMTFVCRRRTSKTSGTLRIHQQQPNQQQQQQQQQQTSLSIT